MEHLCEVISVEKLGRLYEIKEALEKRGIYVEIRRDVAGNVRRVRDHRAPRLMVRERDLVYARWIAYAAGLDPWTDDRKEDEQEPAARRARAAE